MKSLQALLSIGSIIAIIIAFTAGFWFGKNSVKIPAQEAVKFDTTTPASLFYSQSAEIQGMITEVTGGIAKVKSNNGGTAEFKLKDPIYITKYDAKSKPVYSNNPKDLELNKPASITLSLPSHLISRNDAYANFEVSTVTYTP